MTSKGHFLFFSDRRRGIGPQFYGFQNTSRWNTTFYVSRVAADALPGLRVYSRLRSGSPDKPFTAQSGER
ncbi:hypothetical protein FML24_14770 [Klebsiella oxytoca]|nr:hypothetical protein [Klebsiella oxytoca]